MVWQVIGRTVQALRGAAIAAMEALGVLEAIPGAQIVHTRVCRQPPGL